MISERIFHVVVIFPFFPPFSSSLQEFISKEKHLSLDVHSVISVLILKYVTGTSSRNLRILAIYYDVVMLCELGTDYMHPVQCIVAELLLFLKMTTVTETFTVNWQVLLSIVT